MQEEEENGVVYDKQIQVYVVKSNSVRIRRIHDSEKKSQCVSVMTICVEVIWDIVG